MNRNLLVSQVFICLISTFFSCDEPTTKSDSENPLVHIQSSKCATSVLHKANSIDSMFSYMFTDKLQIDFSAWSNCCPDSDRFTLAHVIENDTIAILVVDTAENRCRCTCPYIIHAEFSGLQKDHYVIQCSISDVENGAGQTIIHLVNVYRQN